MLPPPTDVLAEQLKQVDEQEEVFAIIQFNNDFDWRRVAWSAPGEVGGVYRHTHAEVALADNIKEYMKDWQREMGSMPTTSAITIKYSPCPECSRNYLNIVSHVLKSNNVRDNYLYYLMRYAGMGALDALDGIALAVALFSEVDEYRNVQERKNDWREVKARYSWELGF